MGAIGSSERATEGAQWKVPGFAGNLENQAVRESRATVWRRRAPVPWQPCRDPEWLRSHWQAASQLHSPVAAHRTHGCDQVSKSLRPVPIGISTRRFDELAGFGGLPRIVAHTEPGPMPSLRRTSTGTEIWLCEVNFDRPGAMPSHYQVMECSVPESPGRGPSLPYTPA